MTATTQIWTWRGLIGAACLALAVGVAAQDAFVPRAGRARLPDAVCTLDLPQRDAGSIVVLEHDGSDYSMLTPGGEANWDPRVCVARRFYQQHGDNYDFLVVFTNFEFETGAVRAFHTTVRNGVGGIGIPPIDNGTSEGLPGRLKGYVDMAAISRALHDPAHFRPGDPDFQTALHVLAHETGHQWLAQVKYRNDQGQNVPDLLGSAGAHWSYLLDSDASHMYGSDWVRQPGDLYLAERVRERYSSLDLYLMGLLDPAQVPPVTLLRNPVPPHANTEFPNEGDLIAATSTSVEVEQVIAAEGARNPDWLHSQKEFRLGFVFLAAPGTEPTPEQLAAVDGLRDAFQGYFFAQTRGVAIADTVLAEQPAPPPAPVPDLQKAVDWLLAQQRADGSWQDSLSTAPRETALAIEALTRAGSAPAAVAQGSGWLLGQPWESVDFGSRRAMGLALGALDGPGRLELRQELLALRGADGGFGAGDGYASDPLDTALALRALAALGQPADATVTSTLAWLQGQRSAGGWPAIPGGPVTSMATAEVLLAALEWRALPAGQALVSTALVDLQARRNLDGGFGESPSTAYATALALVGLTRAGLPSSETASTVAWLHSHQRADGSWEASRYATALVLVALRGSVGANLTVPADSVQASPATPDEGQVVNVTAVVRSAGLADVGPSHAALYEGAPPTGTLIDTVDVPALPAGAPDHAVGFSYDTTGHAGPRQLYVVADAQAEVEESREDDNAGSVSVTVAGQLADLAFGLDAIALQPDPVATGDLVQVHVTVQNRGERDAPASLLRLVLGDPQQGAQLISTATVPPLGAGASDSLDLSWDTAGVLGQVQLVALADANYTVPESSENNNAASLALRVDPAPPVDADLEAAWVRLEPSSFTTLPQAVSVSVRVRNLGQTTITSTVALFDVDPPSGQPVAELPITLGPRSSQTVPFSYDVTTPGTRTLVAVLDRAGSSSEPDEGNNEARALLTDPANTVDLEILPADVVVTDPDLVAGETLEVTFTIRNRGTRAVASVPVTLDRPITGGFAELARTIVDVPAGGSLTRALTWVTGEAVDPLELALRADPFDVLAELHEDNNQVPLSAHVQASSLPDLVATSAGIAIAPDPPEQGGVAQITVHVTNDGVVDAGAFTTKVYAGDPDLDGVLLGAPLSAGLAAGQGTDVQVSWNPVGTQAGIVAVVDADAQVAEYNETNNRAFRAMGVTLLPDLVLTPGALRPDPAFPHVGESVEIEVRVVNRGQRPNAPAILRMSEVPAGVPQDLLLPAVAPGEAVVLSFTVAATGTPGERRLAFAADAENAVAEQDEGNNTAGLTLTIQDADLYLSAPYFSPNGDGQQDAASLFWRAGGVTHVLVKNRRDRVVRTLDEGVSSGSVTWDGLDAQGSLAFDGAYHLVLVGADGDELGATTVVLDTNRSPLHDAAGLGLTAEVNLTCALPDGAQHMAWLPGEDGVLSLIRDIPPTSTTQLGRIDLEGHVEVLWEDPWLDDVFSFQGVSPDGREVLVGTSTGLQALDLVTRQHRLVTGGGDAEWSPDSQRIRHTERLLLDRAGTLLAELPEFDFWDTPPTWHFSPDALHLGAANQLVDLTGAVVDELPLPPEVAAFEEPKPGAGGFLPDGRLLSAFHEEPENPGARTALVLFDFQARTARVVGRGTWSPDGTKVAFGLPNGTVAADEEDIENALRITSREVAFAPLSAAALFTSDEDAQPGKPCFGLGTFDRYALLNLQNLAARLDVAELPGHAGLQLAGRAYDRHFDYFTLEYAPASSPDAWTPIGVAGVVPVAKGALGVWVPPAAGEYLVRLTVRDLAGNQRTVTRQVAWGGGVSLVNVTQSEGLISPTGDGIKDDVAISYLVVDAVHLEVAVRGPASAQGAGPVVRRFARDYPTGGQADTLVWDGRDEQNVVVPDGRYALDLNGLELLVDVDSTPPEIAIEDGEPFLTLQPLPGLVFGDADLASSTYLLERRGYVVDPHLRRWNLIEHQPPSTEQLFVPARDASGAIIYDGDKPRVARVAGVPVRVTQRTKAMQEASDLPSVAMAEDHAGNVSVIPRGPVAPSFRFLRVASFLSDEVKKHFPADDDPVPDEPIKTPEEPLIVSRDHSALYAGTTSSGLDSHSVVFEYRLPGAASWTPVHKPFPGRLFRWSGDSGTHADWEWHGNGPSAMVEGTTYEARATAEFDGVPVSTRPMFVKPCDDYAALSIASVEDGLHEVSVYATIGEPIAQVVVTQAIGSEPAIQFSLAEDLEHPGVWKARRALPLASCLRRLRLSATLKAVSGRIVPLGDEGVGGCLALTKRMPECNCEMTDPVQDFKYRYGNPDEALMVAARWNPGYPVLLLRSEHGPEATPTVDVLAEPLSPPECPHPLNPLSPFCKVQSVANVAADSDGMVGVRQALSDPQTGEPLCGGEGEAAVDHTPPAIEVQSPVAEGRACVENGRARLLVRVTDASPKVQVTDLEIRQGAGTYSTLTWECPGCGQLQDFAGKVGLSTGTPTEILADVSDLDEGAYTLRLTLYDRSGNRGQIERPLRIGFGPPEVRITGLENPVFSPNADGQFDTSTLRFETFEPAELEAEIRQGAPGGPIVAHLPLGAGPQAPGERSLIWNGYTDQSQLAADDRYYFTVRADVCSLSAFGSAAVGLDTHPPAVSIDSPAPLAEVGPAVDVLGSAGADPYFQEYTLEFGVGLTPAAWTPIMTSSTPVTGGLLGHWDTPSVEGDYTLRLRARDKVANVSAPVTRQVRVGERRFLDSYSVAPLAISPNGDGRKDELNITYALRQDAVVTIQVFDLQGTWLATVVSGIAQPAGTHAQEWLGAGGVEGTLLARIVAADPQGIVAPEMLDAQFLYDVTDPLPQIFSPAEGAVTPGPVQGSVYDAHLESWVLTAQAPQGNPIQLAAGNENQNSVELASLEMLAEGPQTLKLVGLDVAGNEDVATRSIVLDRHAPTVALTLPLDGSVVRREAGPQAVRGRVEDANLLSWTLSFGAGLIPSAYTQIATGTSTGPNLALGTWDVTQLPEATYTLKLEAHDGAHTSLTHAKVGVDTAPPIADISAPLAGLIGQPFELRGSATDAHLERWRLELSPGEPESAYQWSTLTTSTTSVEDDHLYELSPLPPDGAWTLRLLVEDKAGRSASDVLGVRIDTSPPATPSGFTATLRPASGGLVDVLLSWNANVEPDLGSYRLRRAGEATDLPLTGPLVTSGVDLEQTPGVHAYELVALDQLGNVSPPAHAQATYRPPMAVILSPLSGATVNGRVEVKGTASAPTQFGEFRLSVGAGPDPSSFVLLRQSSVPVLSGLLGEWAPSTAGTHVLRLVVEDGLGNAAETTATVEVDLAPPAPPVLVSVETPGGNPDALMSSWTPSASPDAIGTLVYRNGQLANAPNVVDDLRLYLVVGSSYLDDGLPDGEHCYRVRAMDAAGNLSVFSDQLCEELENRAPQALVVQPVDGFRFDHTTTVRAGSADLDVAQVQLEIRPVGGGSWSPLGAPDSTLPYEAALDPVAQGLSEGDYDLRAVATDTHANVDPDPATILVTYGDATPPAPPTNLAAVVDGDTVNLSWTPGDGAAGHHVSRDGLRLTTAPVVDHYDDIGVVLGLHVYEVLAVDASANESLPASVEATVYRPSLDAPAFPVVQGTSVDISGTGASSGGTVTLLGGGAPAPTSTADASGGFAFAEAPLTFGPNFLTARDEDGAGNRSLPSTDVVAITSQPPSALDGLSAGVTDHEVTLGWNVVDPEPFGYLVWRGDTRVTGSSLQLDGDAQATSTQPPHLPSAAFDGNAATSWQPQLAGASWTVTLPAPALVESLRLQFVEGQGSSAPVAAKRYLIEAAWEGRFLPIVTVTNGTLADAVNILPAPFATDALRIWIMEPAFAGLAEVDVTKADVVPGGTTAYADNGVPDGIHTYRVAAIDRYGAVGEADEETVAVGDVVAPAPPTGLVATVEGSDVVLTWNPNGEGDLDHYAVVRDGTVIGTTPTPTYRDEQRPNGTYAYVVRAVDTVGNTSGDSNEVQATVDVQPLGAPILTGVARPDAAAWLTWQHPGAAGFTIARATAAGGPYTQVAQVGDQRSHRDGGLTAGTTYFYVALALDAVGNASPRSNEVEVVAVHVPAAPALLLPTDADRPISVTDVRADVSGRAEAGALVELRRDGVVTGAAVASDDAPLFALNESLAIAGLGPELAASPDGRYAADSPSVALLRVTDLTAGTSTTWDEPGRQRLAAPAFAADSARLAYAGFTEDGGGQVQGSGLYVRELPVGPGAATPVADYGAGIEVGESSFDRDGQRLAFVLRDGSDRLMVADLAGGAPVQVLDGGARRLLRPRFAPGGQHVAVYSQDVGGGPADLLLVGLPGGASTPLSGDADASTAPSFAPDGSRIAYTLASQAAVEVLTLGTGTRLTIAPWAGVTFREPRFSPDGARLGYRLGYDDGSGGQLHVVRVRTLQADEDVDSVPPLTTPPTLLEWPEDGRLLLARAGAVDRLTELDGTFVFEQQALQPGENEFTAQASDATGAGPESRPIHVTALDGGFPNLVVGSGDLLVYPGVPQAGQAARFSAHVHNSGGGAGPVATRLRVQTLTGQVLAESAPTLPFLDAGQTAAVWLDWTPTVSGTLRFEALLDPDDAIGESDETDNRAERAVQTVPANTLQLGLLSDRESYAAHSPALLVASALNGGPAFAGTLETVVETIDGTLVATVDVRPVQLEYGESLDQLVVWNTGTTFAGSYRFVARLVGPNQQVKAEAQQAFAILPSLGATARLIPDALVVPLGQPAGFAARIENTGLNVPLTGAVARLEIRDAGQALAYTLDTPLAALLPGSLWESVLQWPEATPAGTYEARLLVILQGATLATHSASFSVEATAGQVTGQLVVTPAHVELGLPVSAHVTLANATPDAVSAYAWALEIVHGPDPTVGLRRTFVSDLPASGSFTTDVALPTDGQPYGAQTVRLRGGTPELTLARADLRLHAPILAPSANAPGEGATVGTARPDLVVNNGSTASGEPLLYEFELFDNEALGFPIASATGVVETDDMTTWQVPAPLGEDSRYWWHARATDGFSISPWSDTASFRVDAHNEPPPAPRPDSPLPGERVASLSPTLVVGNPVDPDGDTLTYAFRLASDPGMSQIVASAAGLPEGAAGLTSWPEPATLVEDASYSWQARVDDGRGGSPWSAPVSFVVDTDNASPGPPVLLRPAPAGRVESLQVELSIGSAVDPEHDVLLYRIELDTQASFGSPDKQVSPSLPEGLGDTSWVPPVPLVENTRYYWRAAAHDGHTSGPWASSEFFVSSVNEAPGLLTLLDPLDGQVVSSVTPTLKLQNAVDPDEDGLTYRFVVRDQGGTTVVDVLGVPSGATETTLEVPSPLAEDALFEWSAQARDSALSGPMPPFESFRVNAQPQPPTAPTQIAPAEGAIVHVPRPVHVVGNSSSPDGYATLAYSFRLYPEGSVTPIDSADGVSQGATQTAWTPTLDLPEGSYAWTAWAVDPEGKAGPLMQSGHYQVAFPPDAPTGLLAVAGDQQVELSWTPSADPSVVGYRVYRAAQAGGPYQLIGQPSAATHLDTGLVNFVTVYYVVTAVDGLALESARSDEALATPQPSILAAEVGFDPVALSGECALCASILADERPPGPRQSARAGLEPRVECVADNEDGTWSALFGYENGAGATVDVPVGPDNFVTPGPNDHGQPTSFQPGRSRFPQDSFHVEFRDGDVVWTLQGASRPINRDSRRCTSEGPPTVCPLFVHVTIELPPTASPSDIDLASVRLQGTLAADPTYSEIVDTDNDGHLELRVRFDRAGLLPLLVPGPNDLALSGAVGTRTFAGSGTLTLSQPSVGLRFLELGNVEEHKLAVAILSVPACLGPAAVDPRSLYLGGSVVPQRFEPISGSRLRLVFRRDEVLASLPPGGPRVPVTLTGRLLGQPFSLTVPFLVQPPSFERGGER